MPYLTATHKPVPAHVIHAGMCIPTAPLIRANDTARLAELGIYPHETAPGDAPLGYTEWALVDGTYYRQPAGTAEEIATVLAGEIRARLHARRVELRLAHQTGGFVYDGHRYASDRDESIPLLTAAVIGAQVAIASGPEAVAASESAMVGWRSTDGVPRITTAAGVVALHTAFVAHGAACDCRSQTLKGLIDAAETAEDLAALEAEVETGWPE